MIQRGGRAQIDLPPGLLLVRRMESPFAVFVSVASPGRVFVRRNPALELGRRAAQLGLAQPIGLDPFGESCRMDDA